MVGGKTMNHPVLDTTSQNLWRKIVKEISLRIPKSSFNTWIAPAVGELKEENILVITADSAFSRDWLEGKYKLLFYDVLLGLTGVKFEIEIIYDVQETSYVESNIDKEEALAYMLLASKQVDLSTDQTKELYLTMHSLFQTHTPLEAKLEANKLN